MYITDYLKTIAILRYKKLLYQLPLPLHQDYTPFIILCHARTGSTLLHTYLNSHPAIVSLGEQAGKYIKNVEAQDLPFKGTIFNVQPRPVKALGIKFFYRYAEYPRGKIWLQELLEMRSLKVIVLKRENILRPIISSQIARKTGALSYWTSKHHLATEDKKISIDTGACITQLKRMEEEQQRFEELLRNHQRLYLSYEELLSDKNRALKMVQQFLEVRPVSLFSLLRKQNPEPLSQLVVNFDELKDALKATPWKILTED